MSSFFIIVTRLYSNIGRYIHFCFCVTRLPRPLKDQAQGKAGQEAKVESQRETPLLLVRLLSATDQHQQNPHPIQVQGLSDAQCRKTCDTYCTLQFNTAVSFLSPHRL